MSFNFGTNTGSSFAFGGGFGSTSAPTAATTSTTSTFGFGTAPTTTSTGGGFGFGTIPATTSTGTGFGFGSTDTSTGGGFAFGSTPATGTTSTGSNLFGGFNFGSTSNTTSGTSVFGQPTTTPSTGFGTTSTSTSLFPASTQRVNDADNPDTRILAIKTAYDPTSPSCRFQTMFYNRVDPRMIQRYQRPENVSLKMWQQAMKNNPDPTTLVPTHAVGFKDLKARIQEQDKAATSAQTTLDDISRTIDEMQHAHEATTRSVIDELKKIHAQQSHRLLYVMTRLEMIRSRDLPLLMDEIDYRRKLESVHRKLSKPAQFQARVSELASIVRMSEDRPNDTVSGPILDAETVQKITQFLATQRAALDHLTRVIQTDRHDLDAIIRGETRDTDVGMGE